MHLLLGEKSIINNVDSKKVIDYIESQNELRKKLNERR